MHFREDIYPPTLLLVPLIVLSEFAGRMRRYKLDMPDSIVLILHSVFYKTAAHDPNLQIQQGLMTSRPAFIDFLVNT